MAPTDVDMEVRLRNLWILELVVRTLWWLPDPVLNGLGPVIARLVRIEQREPGGSWEDIGGMVFCGFGRPQQDRP